MDNLIDELENLLEQSEENGYDYAEELQEQMENLSYNQHNINDLLYEYAITSIISCNSISNSTARLSHYTS